MSNLEKKDFGKQLAEIVETNQAVLEAVQIAEMGQKVDVLMQIEAVLSLPEVSSKIQWLTNKPMGFLLDGSGLSKDNVTQCCVEAVSVGIPLTGNCFNVIKGKMYITSNGWQYKLRNEGHTVPVPVYQKSVEQKTHTDITFKMLVEDTEPIELTVQVDTMNNGKNIDNLIGRGKAKAFRRYYEICTGKVFPESEDLTIDITEQQGTDIQDKKDPLSPKEKPAITSDILQNFKKDAKEGKLTLEEAKSRANKLYKVWSFSPNDTENVKQILAEIQKKEAKVETA